MTTRDDDPRTPGESDWAAQQREVLDVLQQTEAGFREFIDRCPDGVFIRRGRQMIHVNAALLELLGCERSELIGVDPVDAFVHPMHRAEVLEHRDLHPDLPDLREHRWLRRDGETLIIEVVGVTVTFEGKPARIVMCRDVTERKKMEAKLLVTERMASLGTLAAGIAHEINNPLSSVIANLQLIAEELGSRSARTGRATSELDEMLADATACAERIRRIVRGMRTFSRVDGERCELDLARTIDTAVELASNEIRHRARLTKSYRQIPRVFADEGRLVQVFVNLLVNAAHAIPEGHADRHEIRVEADTDEDGRVVVTVTDTGKGIDPEILGRVFDPFFTTKDVGGGMGIGLSICHSFVASIGGEISVQSEPGKGTTFRVFLPAAPPARSADQL